VDWVVEEHGDVAGNLVGNQDVRAALAVNLFQCDL